MQVKVEQGNVESIEIIIRCAEQDESVLKILALLQSENDKICVWSQMREIVFLAPSEICYAESVDQRIFVYTEDAVFQTALPLGQLAESYENAGYCRCAKSMVVNLHHIRKLQCLQNGRIEATLQNGERVMISRHYAPEMKEKLGLSGRRFL